MFSYRRLVFALCGLAIFAMAQDAFAQRRHRTKKPKVVQTDSTQTPASTETVEPIEIKPDRIVLRYKPQAGTLLYNVRTEVDQHVRTDRDELSGSLISSAQLAFHNVSVDYKKGLWSFDRFFTKFEIKGKGLTGDSLWLNETQAVNRITRLTYEMRGKEVQRQIFDTLRLFNAEAQTNFYFFQPPRMMIPLPEKSITYGDTWVDHSRDTVHVHDTVNIGTTDGTFIYDLYRTYQLVSLIDTFGGHLAVIVANDSGNFEGRQTNNVTNVSLRAHGPIGGSDTTYLDLASGRVFMRSIRMSIPVIVQMSTTTPFTDIMEVRSVVELDQSNARDIRHEQPDPPPPAEVPSGEGDKPKEP
jgi:hypothetical protein